MHGIGIIAEFNPFHNGHAHIISEAKRISGAEYAVIVMSGSFVQRGEPACASKYTRTEWALRGGADMVLELPDVLSLACAERFAMGGVRLLHSSGLVNRLCFGSESGNVGPLKAAAEVVSGEALRTALDAGLSYPAAVSRQLRASGIGLDRAAPNDTLGIEYIRAIDRLASDMAVLSLKRIGAAYNDSETGGRFASAAFIRRKIFDDLLDDVRLCVPSFVFSEMLRQHDVGRFPARDEALSCAILHAMRTLGSDGIANLADVSEGLENVFAREAASSSSYTELLCAVKTRRYTMSRLKRICMNALLGTSAEMQYAAAFEPNALYLHVLGVKRERISLLSMLAKGAGLPVIITMSDVSKLNPLQHRILEHSRRASLIRALACPSDKTVQDDFSHPLIVV